MNTSSDNIALKILVIDDDPFVRSFIRDFGQDLGWTVDTAADGEEGLEKVRTAENRYDLILLDVMLPGLSGLDVLPELLKFSIDQAVVMLSGYSEVGSAVAAMNGGAYDFLQKPMDLNVLETRIRNAIERSIVKKELREYVEDMEKKVRERTTELEKARKATIFGLARLAESRDDETGGHLERMAFYVVELARALVADGLYRDVLDEHYQELLYESAALHDIGKVGIPDALLNKPGRLTESEFIIVQTHTIIGMRAISDIKRMTDGQSFLDIGIEVAGYHHERYDGKGYPLGLKGHNIPLSARILAVGDYYDACVTPRVYRQYAIPHKEVKEILAGLAGSHFDPDVIKAFISCESKFKRFVGV